MAVVNHFLFVYFLFLSGFARQSEILNHQHWRTVEEATVGSKKVVL